MNGIITIAARGEQYARYAENLALSAQRHRVPVSVVVGKSLVKNLHRHLFHKVFEIDDPVTIEDCWEHKLSLDAWDTGYKQTLFIDSDALVVRDLSCVFTQVADVGFLFPAERIMNDGDVWDGKDVAAIYKKLYGANNKLPQVNGGFFGWSVGSPEARLWFTTVREAMRRMKLIGYRREELAMILACAHTNLYQMDPHFVAQMWCCARENSLSMRNGGTLLAKMPWWDRTYNAYIAHFGSGYMIDRAYYWDAIRTLGISSDVLLEPFISVLIPTYARTGHLAEAISSCLTQQYTNFEVVICNDCARQTLAHGNTDHVEMHNLSKQFQTLGEKRNFLLDHARGDIVCFLDDDDLLLPWHLRQIADLFLAYPCDAIRFSRAIAYTRAERSIAWGSAPINVAVRRKVAPRFSSRSTGEDQDFRASLPNAIDVVTDNPTYVYEWANGVFHLSTRDEKTAREDFVGEANKRMDEKQEPEGRIVLPFGFKDDVKDWFIP